LIGLSTLAAVVAALAKMPAAKIIWDCIFTKVDTKENLYPCKDTFPENPPCEGGPAERVCDVCRYNKNESSASRTKNTR
tara:strand:+ start:638 stop:874 length:237 start_codon:yes stop_codon:yes gene_type:complete